MTLHTTNPHSTLYTPHSTLHTLHSTLHTLHSTVSSPDSTPLDYTPHSTRPTQHSTLYTLLQSTLCTSPRHSTLHTLQLYGNRGIMYKTVEHICFAYVFYVSEFGFVGWPFFFLPLAALAFLVLRFQIQQILFLAVEYFHKFSPGSNLRFCEQLVCIAVFIAASS